MRTTKMTLVLLGMLVLVTTVNASTAMTGSAAAKSDSTLGLDDMLNYAMQDEFAAQAEYIAIQAKFGEMRPFSNIARAEASHINWLRQQFVAYKKAEPANDAATRTVIPATLKEAFEIGIKAEIDNIAMYDSFLASPIMAQGANSELKEVFIHLRDASKNHLSSFQRQLGKY